ILISKWEETSEAQQLDLHQQLDALNPYAERTPLRLSEPSPQWLEGHLQQEHLAHQTEARQTLPQAAHAVNLDDEICCFDISWSETQPLPLIGEWLHQLTALYGERLMRAKGIVACLETPNAYSVHVVQHLVSAPQPLEKAVSSSRVVFITRGLEPNDVRPDWPHETRTAPRETPARRRLFSTDT